LLRVIESRISELAFYIPIYVPKLPSKAEEGINTSKIVVPCK
jgi:hypothetical protein